MTEEAQRQARAERKWCASPKMRFTAAEAWTIGISP